MSLHFSNVLIDRVLIEDLTAVTPQVKPLTMKTEATQTQPYPPSGGGSTTESGRPNGNAVAWVLSLLGSGGSLTNSAVPDMLVYAEERFHEELLAIIRQLAEVSKHTPRDTAAGKDPFSYTVMKTATLDVTDRG